MAVFSSSQSFPRSGLLTLGVAQCEVEHLVENVDVLLKARDFMRENNIPIVFEGRKGAGCNIGINFKDPDGYEFEIYCQMDQIDESGRLRPKELFLRAKSLEEAIENPVSETW